VAAAEIDTHAEAKVDRAASTSPASGENGDDLRVAQAALDRLSPDHRMVLVLRLAFGFSIKEIAAMTEAAQSTTRLRLYYARRAFTRAIAGDAE
jgi:DNA-directed RNA polymerase specialized sigma24 family protein